MNSKKLKFITVWSYAFAQGSGYQVMGSVVGAYLMLFLTDTFGVPAAAVSVIMILASIWDAINDPMMGVVADHTKTRWGKFRPYFLFIPVFLTIDVVALFASPNISTTGKIIWTAIFYVGYGMLRTAIEIPCGALINAVTNEEKQRNRMITSYTLVMGIFTTISTSFALVFVSFLGGENTAKGYMLVMFFAGILMMVSCWICFANTEEKYVFERADVSLKRDLKELFKVKGIFLVIIVWLCGFIAYNGMMSSSVYYIMYYLTRPDLISFYMLDISLVGLVGIAIGIPVLMRRCKEVKKAYMLSQVIVLVCSGILFFFGKNLVLLFVLSAMVSFFATMSMVFNSMMMTEMADYIFLCNGDMVNGTMAALKGFSNKTGMAVSNGAISATLALTGYVAGAIGGQSYQTLIGLNFIRFIIPVLTAIVIIIFLQFYPVTKDMKEKFKGLYVEENK